MGTAIDVANLRKTFGSVVALDNLSLSVQAGTIHGLLGPNGAGKTTVVRVLSTLTKPDRGKAELFGVDIRAHPHSARSIIGVTGQDAAIDGLLTGRENLRMIGRLFRLSSLESKNRAADLLSRFELEDAADRQVKTYSGGMRRKLDVAASIIARPRLIFLDEPTTGLDPRSRLEVWQSVRQLVSDGTTVLLTTQYLEEADQLADSLSVIDKGRVIASGTPDELKAKTGDDWVGITVTSSKDFKRTVELLRAVLGVEPGVDPDAMRVDAPLPDGNTLTTLLKSLETAEIQFTDLSIRRPTLDDVFLALTETNLPPCIVGSKDT